jgi:hypothetical protein
MAMSRLGYSWTFDIILLSSGGESAVSVSCHNLTEQSIRNCPLDV